MPDVLPFGWSEPVDPDVYGAVTHEVDRLCSVRSLNEALDLIESTWPGRPTTALHPSRIDPLIVRAVLEVRLDRPSEAFGILDAMARCGASVPLDAAVFDSLKALPGYADLRQRNGALLARERAGAAVEIDVLSPIALGPEAPAPLMLVLHGDPGNLGRSRAMWPAGPIVERDVFVAFVQSSQLQSTGRYVWSPDPALARSDVRKAYRDLCRRHPVDKDRVILAGFSAGATVALDLVIGCGFPAVGFVCVSPGGRPESFAPATVADAKARGVRGVFLEGSDEWPDEETAEMVDAMEDGGLPVELMLHEGPGHVAPPDFAERLARAVGFILAPPQG